GAAAEDLHDALQFGVAAYQRVELVVERGLGEVAGKLGQKAGLAVTLLRRGLFLRGAGKLLANGRELEAALVQNFRSEALFLAQQAEEQVFGPDMFVRQPLGFLSGI